MNVTFSPIILNKSVGLVVQMLVKRENYTVLSK